MASPGSSPQFILRRPTASKWAAGISSTLAERSGIEASLRNFVAYYNNERYHEWLDDGTLVGVYLDRQYGVLTERVKIKRLTMKKRTRDYLAARAA